MQPGPGGWHSGHPRAAATPRHPMAEARHDVLLVGLGAVAESHLTVLERIPGAKVIAGVDTASKSQARFRGHPVPVQLSLREPSYHNHTRVAVTATLTPAH